MRNRPDNPIVKKLRRMAHLSDQDVDYLEADLLRVRRVPARYDLIREGDQPGPVFAIISGWACRYKILPEGTRQIMAFLMPGDCCDVDAAQLAEMDHGIQTLSPVTFAAIPRDSILELMRRPGLRDAFRNAQLIDEATMRSWMVSMGRRSGVARVAHLICELYLRAADAGLAVHGGLDLPISQIVLADALGVTPVHINRVLRQFRLTGVMTFRTGILTIRNAAALATIAGFDENYLHRRRCQVAVEAPLLMAS